MALREVAPARRSVASVVYAPLHGQARPPYRPSWLERQTAESNLRALPHLDPREPMSTVRPGNQPTLVVVDIQIGVMAESWEAPRVIKNLARAVERAREDGVPVIWIQHEADDLPRGSSSWQLVPELVPAVGETRVYKRFPSSFEETDLEESPARLGTTHIVLAGAQTNWCIRATAYAALDRGYDLTLLKDAHTTASIDLGNGSKVCVGDCRASGHPRGIRSGDAHCLGRLPHHRPGQASTRRHPGEP